MVESFMAAEGEFQLIFEPAIRLTVPVAVNLFSFHMELTAKSSSRCNTVTLTCGNPRATI